MRVDREFRRPEVVQWLETADEEDLALIVAGESAYQLTEEQREGVRQAMAQMDADEGVPHEKVGAWLKSLGTDNPLPKPTCK